jgi:uncharacterized membrane protein YphA (DoxX/SURF4 family)
MSLVRLVARPLLASSFIWSGIERLRSPEEAGDKLEPQLRRAAKMAPVLEEAARRPVLTARVLGAVQVSAGLLFAFGRFPRLSASLLVGSAALSHLANTEPQTAASRLKNASLAGGVLLASVDTAGSPSLAWRAQHLGADARKQLRKTNKELGQAVKRTALEARKTAEDVIGH